MQGCFMYKQERQVLELNWQSYKENPQANIPPMVWERITDPTSVTQYLEERLRDGLQVEVANEGWYYPRPSEAACVDLKPREKAWLRETYLRGNSSIWLYAWSLFPENILAGKYKALQRLGCKSIEKILTQQTSIQRSDFEIAKVEVGHPIYQKATRELLDKPTLLWARRSRFKLDNKNILMNEVFLPQFFSC